MDDAKLLELIPEYALGVLEGEEKTAVEALLERSTEARRLFAEYDSLLVNAVLLTTPVRQAPPNMTADFAARLRAEAGSAPPLQLVSPPAQKPAASPRTIPRPALLLLAAAILAVVIGIGVVLRGGSNIDPTQQEIAQIVGHTGARRVVVDFPNSPGVNGTLIYIPTESRAVLEVAKLQALPDTQAYAVWLIDTVPRASGLFNATGETTRYLVRANAPINDYQAVALSIEPSTGSTAPTTNPIASGRIASALTP
jgi:anti-sigma-K factor RskA